MCGGLGVFWVELSYKSTKLNARHGTLLFMFVQKSTMLKVGAKVHKIFETSKNLAWKCKFICVLLRILICAHEKSPGQ